MYFDINKYIINMVPELKRTKDTTQYKFLSNLMKGYEEIRGTQNQIENMELGVYPFIEPDFYFELSTSTNFTTITEDIETYLSNNLFTPTSLVQSGDITSIKSVKMPQFVQNNLYYQIRKQNKSKDYIISNDKITNVQNGEDFQFVQNGKIIDYNKTGNIFYCLEQDRIEQFSTLNSELIFSQIHSMTNIEGFQLIPNGLLIKHTDGTYDNFQFLFEYDFEIDSLYYSLNHNNQNITNQNVIYTFYDHMQNHIPFQRTNCTIQQKLIQNIVYSNIMQQTKLSETYKDAKLKPLFDQYTDIGYKEKIKIVNEILTNPQNY